MTSKADLSEQEWKAVLQGPPAAGMLVITAEKGGMFKETIALSKAYVHARSQHGASQLLDEIVSAKPEMDATRYHSPGELHDAEIAHLRDAATVLSAKASPQEASEYRSFVLSLARQVAAAHREGGQDVSPAEQQAIGEISAALSPAA